MLYRVRAAATNNNLVLAMIRLLANSSQQPQYTADFRHSTGPYPTVEEARRGEAREPQYPFPLQPDRPPTEPSEDDNSQNSPPVL